MNKKWILCLIMAICAVILVSGFAVAHPGHEGGHDPEEITTSDVADASASDSSQASTADSSSKDSSSKDSGSSKSSSKSSDSSKSESSSGSSGSSYSGQYSQSYDSSDDNSQAAGDDLKDTLKDNKTNKTNNSTNSTQNNTNVSVVEKNGYTKDFLVSMGVIGKLTEEIKELLNCTAAEVLNLVQERITPLRPYMIETPECAKRIRKEENKAREMEKKAAKEESVYKATQSLSDAKGFDKLKNLKFD